MHTTETILHAVCQLQPVNRNIVGTVASALLASQKLSANSTDQPALLASSEPAAPKEEKRC